MTNHYRMLFVTVLYALLTSATAPHVAAQTAGSGAHIMLTRSGYEQRRAAQPNSPATVNLIYHSGNPPVMHTLNAHVIFWDPNTLTTPLPAGYMTLINRWFHDIGGSYFWGLVTQYYQNPGPVHMLNVSTYGGSWHDTTNAYPHTGTTLDPLTDADIQAEVSRAITANGWPKGLSDMYFVYTEEGIESCLDASTCTPGVTNPAYCAYHGFFVSSAQDVIYANQPYDETWSTSCRDFFTSPNGNIAADSTISTTSHEQFEAATDPLLNAWYDTTGNEIGDKCAYNYGDTGTDGRNQTLNGHPYITQLEWSNAVGGCDKLYFNGPIKKTFLPLSQR